MGDYFKPLRRKIGVVTLVLACILMAGWMWSNVYTLGFRIDGPEPRSDPYVNYEYQVAIVESYVYFFRRPGHSNYYFSQGGSSGLFVESLREWPLDGLSLSLAQNIEWKLDLMRFQISKGKSPGMILLILPIWSIVIPLTLISAWLLLSTPRSKPAATPPVPLF